MNYGKGQRISVTYEATILSGSDTGLYVKRSDGNQLWIRTDINTVTPLDPPDWPPQVGDIWKADGTEWFARYSSEVTVRLVPDNNHGMSIVPEDLKARNPVLVRRRAQLWD